MSFTFRHTHQGKVEIKSPPRVSYVRVHVTAHVGMYGTMNFSYSI